MAKYPELIKQSAAVRNFLIQQQLIHYLSFAGKDVSAF
jgi:hypothetical protein